MENEKRTGMFIPTDEIKNTLANADAVLLKVRGDILPRVENLLIHLDAILVDVRAIVGEWRSVVVKLKL